MLTWRNILIVTLTTVLIFLKCKRLFGQTICREPFIPIAKKCYYFEVERRLNWYQSLIRCQEKNAILWTPENAEEFHLISEYMTKNEIASKYEDSVWTAAACLGHDREFYWFTNGRKVATGKWFWRQDEPNNWNYNEQCCAVDKSYGKHNANDASCFLRFYYICEYSSNLGRY